KGRWPVLATQYRITLPAGLERWTSARTLCFQTGLITPPAGIKAPTSCRLVLLTPSPPSVKATSAETSSDVSVQDMSGKDSFGPLLSFLDARVKKQVPARPGAETQHCQPIRGALTQPRSPDHAALARPDS